MAIDLSSLKTEIMTDPVPMGYSGKGSGDIANLLNAKTRSMSQPMEFRLLLKWLTKRGLLTPLKDTAARAQDPDAKRTRCESMLLLLTSPHTETFDMTDPDMSNLVDSLVTDGVFSSADRTALNSAIAALPASRCEELFGLGSSVSYRQVAQALAS